MRCPAKHSWHTDALKVKRFVANQYLGATEFVRQVHQGYPTLLRRVN